VYLPDDLKARPARAARISGESEAHIIRSALEQRLAGLLPRPRSSMVGAIPFDEPDPADEVDDVLAAGFG
jgi:hypothetical protein